MSLGDLQGWLRRLAGWLGRWRGKRQAIKVGGFKWTQLQGCGVENSTLKCCFWETKAWRGDGETGGWDVPRQLHLDGRKGRGPGWREGMRMEGKSTLIRLLWRNEEGCPIEGKVGMTSWLVGWTPARTAMWPVSGRSLTDAVGMCVGGGGGRWGHRPVMVSS